MAMHLPGETGPLVGCSSGDPEPMLFGMKVLALRRPDACSTCGALLEPGTKAAWDPERRRVHCLPCQDGPPDLGDVPQLPAARIVPPVPEQPRPAGASAQREYDRRSARREQRVRTQHPRLGGLLLALNKEPVSTRVWAQGAAGERAVAAKLDELADEHVVALHDRKMRRPDGTLSKANIDHLAVTAAGVWVIDAKTHQGALEVRRSGGLFSPRIESLYINGRDRTGLVHGLLKQVAAVRTELETVQADVPVRGALCFVGTELPWFGSSSIVGVPLVGRRALAKLMRSAGDLAPEDRHVLVGFLDQRFPPAS
jgi:hypothetical protein